MERAQSRFLNGSLTPDMGGTAAVILNPPLELLSGGLELDGDEVYIKARVVWDLMHQGLW